MEIVDPSPHYSLRLYRNEVTVCQLNIPRWRDYCAKIETRHHRYDTRLPCFDACLGLLQTF